MWKLKVAVETLLRAQKFSWHRCAFLSFSNAKSINVLFKKKATGQILLQRNAPKTADKVKNLYFLISRGDVELGAFEQDSRTHFRHHYNSWALADQRWAQWMCCCLQHSWLRRHNRKASGRYWKGLHRRLKHVSGRKKTFIARIKYMKTTLEDS